MSEKHRDAARKIAREWYLITFEKEVAFFAAALANAEREGMKRAAEIAKRVGNFGDYRREELNDDYGKPRFDIMNEITSEILSEAGKGE